MNWLDSVIGFMLHDRGLIDPKRIPSLSMHKLRGLQEQQKARKNLPTMNTENLHKNAELLEPQKTLSNMADSALSFGYNKGIDAAIELASHLRDLANTVARPTLEKLIESLQRMKQTE